MTLCIVYMYVTYDNSQFETTEQSVPAKRQACIESVLFFSFQSTQTPNDDKVTEKTDP